MGCVQFSVESSVESSAESINKLENNEMILNEVHLPIELIECILCYVDEEKLLDCQLVCKCWKNIIRNYVWRKKAENTTGYKFPSELAFGWKEFYLMSKKNFFDLITWSDMWAIGWDYWQLLSPKEVDVNSYLHGKKHKDILFKALGYTVRMDGRIPSGFIIDINDKFMPVKLLDHMQPPIQVSISGLVCNTETHANFSMENIRYVKLIMHRRVLPKNLVWTCV